MFPLLKHYYYNVDAHRYFNPASMVKMPLAFLSLEKLNTLHKPGVNKYTQCFLTAPVRTNKSPMQTAQQKNNFPSIAHTYEKAFLISDNDAYNRMYEFLGQTNHQRRLHELGYPEIRITQEIYADDGR